MMYVVGEVDVDDVCDGKDVGDVKQKKWTVECAGSCLVKNPSQELSGTKTMAGYLDGRWSWLIVDRKSLTSLVIWYLSWVKS